MKEDTLPLPWQLFLAEVTGTGLLLLLGLSSVILMFGVGNLLWGRLGQSINFAVTQPGKGYSIPVVVTGEVATTFCLISTLCLFLAFHPLRRFTPFAMPVLFAIMSPIEAGISGMSLNPARSFGPAVISGVWTGWWIYWIGPVIGGVLAILVCNIFAKRIEVAKLYYFDSDPQGVFRSVQRASAATT